MKINIYYWNNNAGVVNHSILIKNLLKQFDVRLYDISQTNNDYRNSNLGIFIQNVEISQLENNDKNVFIVTEEWLTQFELNVFNSFDYIFVHSEYAKSKLDLYHKNVIVTGFFSLDRYFFPHNTGKILHFKGRSIQKNHELVFNYKNDVTIIDSEINYLTEDQVNQNLNNHDIHICCSLYEAWGHYVWEAMSCGKLVVCSEIPVFKEYLNPDLVKFIKTDRVIKFDKNYRFLNSNNYLFREGYFINKFEFDDLLDNTEDLLEFQKKNRENIREHFLETNRKNKQKFLNIIKFIL